MPRPNQSNAKRREMIPVVARAFADLGYRRTTTAELAKRCGVRENILYRLWPDKKAMFIASIEHVYELSARTWEGLLDGKRSDTARRLLSYEARHIGEYGHARIIFAGLSETDDPEIRRALARMYLHYQQFVKKQVAAGRAGRTRKAAVDPALAAWALIGLGTVTNIAKELSLLNERDRRRLMAGVGGVLLKGRGE